MHRLRFRQKILLFAIAMVVAIQLVTLFPVLRVIRTDSDAQATRSVKLAGTVLTEFMDNRRQQLLTTASVIVADYGFREATASGDSPTIRSALQNHARRGDADFAMLLSLDGSVLASTLDVASSLESSLQQVQRDAPQSADEHSVLIIDGKAFQTVSVFVRSPLPVARVLLAFEIDAELVQYLGTLTGLSVTVGRLTEDTFQSYASTLPAEQLASSLEEIRRLDRLPISTASEMDLLHEYVTLLEPFGTGSDGLYAALQLPVTDALASYKNIRLIILAITGLSLVIASLAAFWIAGMVTKPVDKLASAARRIKAGVYTERISTEENDELGELAAGFNAMQTAIAEREAEIFHSAHHDSLTGLPNRALVISKLETWMEEGRAFHVASLTVDRFSGLVTSLGHEVNDRVIIKLGQILLANLQGANFLGHVHGYEFVVLVDSTQDQEIVDFLLGVDRRLQEGLEIDGAKFSLQLRAGVTIYPDHADESHALLYRAAIARAEAVVQHDVVVHYQPRQEDQALKQIRLIGELPRALDEGELELHFQPKVNCRTREICGAEALVRWQHPELGMIPPFEFINALEQAGTIALLTRWVLKAAIAECQVWRKHGISIGIAVNISADDVLDENLPYFLLDLVRQSDVKPGDITLEVTESSVMDNLVKSLSVIACIHELGFRLSIDDFGTGHSSLAQLRRLPVAELKIDRSFLQQMEDNQDSAIVRATIELAKGLGLQTCAEGIEQLEVLDKLADLGAHYGQGFAISKPLPAEAFLRWYTEWNQHHGESTASVSSRANS